MGKCGATVLVALALVGGCGESSTASDGGPGDMGPEAVDGAVDDGCDFEITFTVDAGFEVPAKVAPTPDGGLVAVGSFTGTLSLLGETREAADGGAYVFALDADGALRWLRVFSTGAGAMADDVAVTDAGDAWVVGRTDGMVELGSATSAGAGVFLVRLSDTGDVEHAASFVTADLYGLPNAESLLAVSPDGSAVYFTGRYEGDSLGDLALPTRTECVPAPFLARYSAEDGLVWAEAVGYVATDVDANADRVLVVGDGRCSGDSKGFSLLSSDGDPITEQIRPAAWSGAVLDDGRVVIAEGTWAASLTTIDIAADELSREAGVLESTPEEGASAVVVPRAFALSPDGTMAVGGAFGGTLSAGATTIGVSAGDIDAFLTTFALDGSFERGSVFGSPVFDETRSIAFDAEGRLIAGGTHDQTGAFVLRRCE